jgi:hypothetical protein
VKHISFHLTIKHLWGLIALVGIFVFINTHPIRPNDFWWHIAVGREIIASGKIPTTDIYSYTEAGQPYPSYQMFWLMEITLFELYNLGGPALVVFFHSLMITSAYCIIFWLCLKITRSWRIASFALLFAAALGINDWNVRPQGITFLLASLFLLSIYQYRQTRRWSWLILIPVSMLIWANSHGTFIIGFAIIGIWLGQELWEGFINCARAERKAIVKAIIIPISMLLLTVAVTFINPRGIGILDYIKTLTSNSVVQNLVTEWAPPSLNSSLGVIFFGCLIGSAILLAISPKRPDFSQIAAFASFGLLSIKTSRGIVWFGLMMAPIIADHISATVSQYLKARPETKSSEGSKAANYIFACVILVMGIITLPWFKPYLPLPAAKAGLISGETPVQATQFLLEHDLPGRLFNSMSFGSYLIWSAYPQYQVFVDPRIELFSEKVWMDYLNISSATGDWEISLNNYGVNTMILSPDEQSGLIQKVRTSTGWKLLYEDNSAVIFGRK